MSSYDTWHNLLSGISQGSFEKIYVKDANGIMTDILILIAAGGGSGSGAVTSANLPLSINNGVLSLDVSGFATAATSPLNLQNGLLTIDLNQYSTTSQITAILANYVTSTSLTNSLSLYTDTAGLTTLLAGKISTSHPASNIGAAAVDFGAYGITAGTLTLTNKDLTKGSSGELLWGGQELQLRANAFQQINAVAPISVSGSNTLTIESLWKPSTVAGTHITTTADDALGTLALAVDTSTIATVSSVNTSLSSKQDTLTAGSNILLSNNVISAVGDATQAWVTANFLSPLNPGTVGVLAGLQATMTANTLIIGVDENTDSRTKFILRDSGNVARNITANTSGQLVYDGTSLATEAQLATKQNTLSTAGQGVFLNGSVLSGYDLRWNTSAVPSGPIQCLHFKSGLDVTQAVNLSSGQVELQIEGRTDIADITGLQAQVNKVSDMIEGVSGISLGTGAGASQRIAVYEIEPGQALTAGHYFYGMGLFEGQAQGLGVGTGFWGGSGLNLPDMFGIGGGQLPHALITYQGNMGIGNVNPSQRLHVTGNILCSGSITGSTKSFDIEHPDASKAGQRLRHWCYEGDDPGGAVMYRRQLQCNRGNNVLQMPSWFQHLCTDVLCFSSPVHHFGLTWAAQGEDDPNQITIGASKDGLYNVLVTARRKDKCATTMCPQAVEYVPVEPTDNGEAFP